MRRIIVAASAVFTLSAILAACGSQSTSPDASPPVSTSPNPTTSNLDPYRVYSEDSQVILFTAKMNLNGTTFDDGKLWVKFKGSGETRLATGHPQFGTQPYVQGAVAAPDGLYAYTLVSTATATGQNDVLYRVSLRTGKINNLGNIKQLGLESLNARTLTISPDGRTLAFRASHPVTIPASATETGREETYAEPAVYQLSLPAPDMVKAQISQQDLRLVKPDEGEGWLPRLKLKD